MIGTRSGEKPFSYLDFCAEDRDGNLDLLLSELQGYVTGLIRESMAGKVSEIITNLNSIGHNLEPSHFEASGFDFVDRTRRAPDMRLRLSVRVVVSVGFEEPWEAEKESR